VRLRVFAILYGTAIAVHLVDHLRRGPHASPAFVLVAGGLATVFQAIAIWMVLTDHPRAVPFVLAVTLADVVGVVTAHLIPNGQDPLVGAHAAAGANAFSAVTAALEVATGLALAWAAWTQRHVSSS
jgi:hypothetical protein